MRLTGARRPRLRLRHRKRRDYLNKLSRNVVNQFGRIAIEDLNIKGSARGLHARHLNDASYLDDRLQSCKNR